MEKLREFGDGLRAFLNGFNPHTKAIFARAFRTVAQTALAILLAHDRVSGVHWGEVLDVAAMAGMLSVLTSVSTGIPESPVLAGLPASESSEEAPR